ncbi:hypothetical protein YC2023_049125 [Brassica napus]
MAMATAVTPIAMAEAGSSSYGNAQNFNSLQLTNDKLAKLWTLLAFLSYYDYSVVEFEFRSQVD